MTASAQSNQDHLDDGVKKMTSSADTMFAMKAAQGGLAEVQLGQLAAQKAADPDVKTFGQKMVDDHTKLNDQMKTAAVKERMTLPTTMNPRHQALYDKLKNASGAQFDKAYMSAMVKDHEEDIKEFNKEANHGKNPDLKQLAQSAVSLLQQHLTMAKTTEARVKSGS